MSEALGYAESETLLEPPEDDVDALLARDPSARRYFEDDPGWEPDPAREAELDALPRAPGAHGGVRAFGELAVIG